MGARALRVERRFERHATVASFVVASPPFWPSRRLWSRRLWLRRRRLAVASFGRRGVWPSRCLAVAGSGRRAVSLFLDLVMKR